MDPEPPRVPRAHHSTDCAQPQHISPALTLPTSVGHETAGRDVPMRAAKHTVDHRRPQLSGRPYYHHYHMHVYAVCMASW